MAILKVGSLNLCSSQGKTSDLRNKGFLESHMPNSVIFKF